MSVIRVAGYAPSTSTHSGALDLFRRSVEERSPETAVEIVWNIVEVGRPVGDLLGLVESGDLTMCYLSTSYLTERVPELAFIDTPYRFASLAAAHQALDGHAGRILSERTVAATGLEVLGYWDNGYRHLSNRLREVRQPKDCAGMTVRVQPSPIHQRMIELWGATPVPTDLKEGISLIASGGVDAQENPLSNTVAYGVDRHHPHITLTRHVYGARGVYANADQVRSWPAGLREVVAGAVRDAVTWQRRAAAEEEDGLVETLRRQGSAIVSLSDDELGAFAAPLRTLRAEIDAALPPNLLEATR